MKRWTYEEVKEYIEEFGHKLLSDKYKNNYTKLLVQCPLGHRYEVTFHNFKDSKQRCPICSNERKKLTYEEVKYFIESFGYELLSEEYENCMSKLKLKCNKGHEYYASWNSFQGGSRCPYCNGNAKLSYEYVKECIESFNYKLLSTEYKNNHTKLLIKCPENHKYEVRFNDFQQGSRCPYCDISKGEQRIMDWLNKNSIEYIYEKTFEELLGINNGLLSYDFYLPKYNLLIEYQGSYHDGTAGNQSEKELEIQQEHDRRKRLYARKNNIQLLEIWYWDFENIEKILSDTLEEV